MIFSLKLLFFLIVTHTVTIQQHISFWKKQPRWPESSRNTPDTTDIMDGTLNKLPGVSAKAKQITETIVHFICKF